jgi:hypothetical protein
LICPDAGATQRTQAIANGINPQRQQAIEVIHCEKNVIQALAKLEQRRWIALI